MNPVDWRTVIERHYPDGEARAILVEHSRQVAELALEINRRKSLGINETDIESAAMLHDIGIILTDAPGIGCHGSEPYIRHGILGADLLRSEGLPEWVARVAERHTGVGLMAEDIARQGLPLPADRILVPETTLERLICYADKFYSKTPGHLRERKTYDRVRASVARHGADNERRFKSLSDEFGPV